MQLQPEHVRIILKLLGSLLTLLLAMLANRLALKLLGVRIKDSFQLHTLHMLLRNSIFLISAAIVLLIWLGGGSNFSVAMGILGAGIAFASQEVIGSFTGYLNIVMGGLYRIGDRVRVGNVLGDVLDINTLRTTVMEIGEWVQADQYTGRVVSIANRAVFSDPVFNYTQHWRYLWDEITIPFTYESDWKRAGELLLEHGQEYSSHLQAEAEVQLDKMMRQFPIHKTGVDPRIYVTMTDNWIEMTMRYIVEARERREVKGKLHRELLQHFEAEPTITVASATFEIVGFPPVKVT